MKILLASSSSGSRGGGELYLVHLGRVLAQRGHTVTLWVTAHPRMDELANTFVSFGEVIRSSQEISPRPGPAALSGHYNPWSAFRIAREWRRSGAEVVHINKQNLEDGLELLLAARRSRLASICTVQVTASARSRGLRFAALRDRIARRALGKYRGMLVAVLPQRRQELLDFLDTTPRVRLVTTGVPLYNLAQRESLRATKRAELGFGRDHLVFLSVGPLVRPRRPLFFLEEAERLLKILPQARFLWVGEGPLAPAFDDQVTQRGLASVVRRLPWQMDLQPYLFSADAMLHAADYEGVPQVILEALSAGLPCALTPNLLAEMPFLNESNSLCIGEDPHWACAIAEPTGLIRLSGGARWLAEHEFSLINMVEHYEMLYQVSIRSEA